MKHSLYSLIIAFLLVVPAAATEPFVTTLDNGIGVAVIENHQSPVVSARVYVRTGSIHEQEFLGAGVSHFLEHLVAGGTTSKRTEAESRALLDAIGAQSNAYTTRDHTSYYITTSSRFFDEALNMLADWTTNASITQEEFDRELEVIQREMESRWSNPVAVLHQTMSETLFKKHPVRHPVIGYREAFSKLTRDDVMAYYQRRYVPNNLLVVVAGDVRQSDAVAKVQDAFGNVERRPMPAVALPAEPRQLGLRESVKEMPAGQAYLLMAYRTIPLSHPDLYPLDIISFILSHGDSSRLVRSLREEQRLVSGIAAWSHTPGYDAGEFAVYATLSPDKLPQVKAAVREEVTRFCDELVSDAELRRAKRQKISSHVFGQQTVEAQAATVASDILSAHDPLFSRSYVERIQNVTAEEIREAARRYFHPENLSIAVVRPPVPDDGVTDTVTESTATSPVIRHELPNGLRLLVKRNPTPAIVSIQAFFLAGVRAEPPERNGLSLFTARMMTRGTPYGSAEEIAEAFDAMGGSLAGASGNNSLYLSAACLSEDFNQALSLFADAVREPTFPAEEVERVRALLVASARRRNDDWRSELSDVFRKERFKTHPYRFTAGGVPETLSAITRDDLVAFHAATCAPSNTVLAIFGDVDPETVTALVEDHFGSWRPQGHFAPPAPPAESRLETDRTVRTESRHRMGGVFVGCPGLTLYDTKDRYAMDVLDALVSGIHLPRGWLHEELRGKGLVYEVHAYNFFGLEPGFFGVYAGCEPDKAEQVKEIILRQLRRVSEDDLPDSEMDAARRICVTADVLQKQTNAQQATETALNELYGLGVDYSQQYAPGILAVSADDVRRVAKKYLHHFICVFNLPRRD